MTAPRPTSPRIGRITDRCTFVGDSNLAHRIRYREVPGTEYLEYLTACGLPMGVVHVGFTFTRPPGSLIRCCPLCFCWTDEGTGS